MRFILILILISSSTIISAQQSSLHLTRNSSLPTLSLLSLNTSISNTSKLSIPDFSNVKVNRNFREIKEGSFVMSKDAFLNHNQFDYEVFKYTPADALRKITPNYDLNSAPLPSPTYYHID
jgi:hypothetical protein